MALSKKHDKYVCGKIISFEKAYYQITHIEGSKNGININVTVYDSEEKCNIVDNGTYTFVPCVDNAPDFIQQGYEHLKTLTEYAYAKDC